MELIQLLSNGKDLKNFEALKTTSHDQMVPIFHFRGRSSKDLSKPHNPISSCMQVSPIGVPEENRIIKWWNSMTSKKNNNNNNNRKRMSRFFLIIIEAVLLHSRNTMLKSNDCEWGKWTFRWDDRPIGHCTPSDGR